MAGKLFVTGSSREPYAGPHLQVPHFVPRAPAASPHPQMMMPQHGGGGPAAIYPPHHFGYWYPPDFQYQQALANQQMLQNYYTQLYGLTSPTASPYHQYVGYMSPQAPTPRPLLPPAQQVAVQPLMQHPPPAQQVAMQPLLQHHPTPQIQGSFFPAPSLPPNFRLQLPPPPPPPQALPAVLPPSTTESQPADQVATSAARVTNASGAQGA